MRFKYYQEIKLLPDQEVNLFDIGAKLFSILHQNFVFHKDSEGKSRYALSFPEYLKGGNKTFGRIFRIFAEDVDILKQLDIPNIVNKLSGYAICNDIQQTPEVDKFLKFYRLQPKTNKERLIRRMMKRKGVSEEEAKEAYKNYDEPRLNHVPLFNISSNSSKQKFCIIIDCKQEFEEKIDGFSCYGLSTGGNVPDF